ELRVGNWPSGSDEVTAGLQDLRAADEILIALLDRVHVLRGRCIVIEILQCTGAWLTRRKNAHERRTPDEQREGQRHSRARKELRSSRRRLEKNRARRKRHNDDD